MEKVWITHESAVLVGPSYDWPALLFRSLVDGATAIVVIDGDPGPLEARRAGFEVRDTLLILSGNKTVQTALLIRKPGGSLHGWLNIDACRPTSRRWPANVVLIHHDGCREKSCSPGCPIRILDEQTGERPSTLTGRADPTKTHGNPGDNHGKSLFGGGNSHVYADSGGASRFYPQFKDDDELFAWFQRLLEPVKP